MSEAINKTKKEKFIYGLKAIGGAVLLPLLFILFTLDRVILVFLPHKPGQTIQEKFKSMALFVPSLYRVGAFLTVYIIKLIIQSVF